MIAKIKGLLEDVRVDRGYIMTESGICYEMYVTPKIASKVGEVCTVCTHLVVREDSLTLFAFDDINQQSLFDMLISVDGVGPKMGYGIINHASFDEIISAVAQSDLGFFMSIKGVGKKTAQKILIDLAGRMGKDFDVKDSYLSDDETMIVAAMETLGFEAKAIHKILKALPTDIPVEERIREGIRLLTQKK